MTTKTISTYSAGSYKLSSSYSELDITATGGFGNYVYSDHFATISNAGTIRGSSSEGVILHLGGVVVNQRTGFIGGRYIAIQCNVAATVTNYGTVQASEAPISFNLGGSVTNGNYLDQGALISGGEIALFGAPGTVANFGTITSSVIMNKGGKVTNGGVDDTAALMNGGGGIYLTGAAGTVSNFGTIQAYGTPGTNGINLGAGGQVANGAVSDTAARIEGGRGVLISGPLGTVTNFGLIDGTGAFHGAYGVLLGGGSVTNGTAAGQHALIEGYTGVSVSTAAGTVTNAGIIDGLGVSASQFGVYLEAGGKVTNGGGVNRSALIEGADGVDIAGVGAATVKNFGTILATGAAGIGVSMSQGALTNGSLNNAAALIEGYGGAILQGTAVSSNFGTILGEGDAGGYGVELGGGESLINGAAGHAAASIQGYGGVDAVGAGNTVTNFGTIAGAGGTAVLFGASSDVLIVEAGSTFLGGGLGGGGTLDLASGVGTLTGLLSTGGNVTVSGSMATTTFQHFGTVEIGAGASFKDTGAVTIAAGQTVNAAGTLTLGGSGSASIVNSGLIETTGSGTLAIQGAVTGTGTAKIGGGTLFFSSTFNEPVTFTGTTGVLELAKSQTYTAAVRGFSKTGGTSLDLNDIAFGGSTKATFSGTATSGVLTVTDGTHTANITLLGNYLTSSFVVSSDGHGGTTVHDPAKAPAQVPPPHLFIAAMAGFGVQAAESLRHAGETWRAPSHILAAPRLQTV